MLIPSLFGAGSSGGISTVNGVYSVSSFSPFSDGTHDDLPAFIACVNACVAAGGGIVDVDVPLWFLGSTGGSWDALVVGASNVIFNGRGDGAPINLKCTATPITLANFNLVRFVDLVFYSSDTSSPVADCPTLVNGHSWQMIFEGCSFINLLSTNELLSLFLSKFVFRDCKFGGCGTLNGPGIIRTFQGAKLILDDTDIIDYGWVKGVNYNGRTNPIFPWVHFRSNGSIPGEPTSVADGCGLHVRDCFFDEGRTWALDVDLEDPDKPRIHTVIVEDTSLDIGVQTGGGYQLSGIDNLWVAGGDMGLHTVLNGMVLRNIRHAKIERVLVNTGAPCVIDADNTVTFIEVYECPGFSKSGGWAPGLGIWKLNGVDV